ncbi:MAG: hypothetical protein Q9159_004962 [Coniocarpon cinnabarinum]
MDSPKSAGAKWDESMPKRSEASPAEDFQPRKESVTTEEATSSPPESFEKVNVNAVTDVTTKQHLSAAATLAEAFEHDDVARYLVDVSDTAKWSEEKRWNLHSTLMNYITYAHAKRGLATYVGTSEDPFGSVALWMYPNKTLESASDVISTGLWKLAFKLTSDGRKRGFGDFFPLLGRTKKEILGSRAKDCYYLVYIGTKPGCRGLGLARQLIQEAAKRADEEGKPMYLESSAKRNVKFYRSLGFEVRKQVWLAGLNAKGQKIPMDIMVREPGGLLTMEAVDSGISMTPQATRERIDDRIDHVNDRLESNQHLKGNQASSGPSVLSDEAPHDAYESPAASSPREETNAVEAMKGTANILAGNVAKI